MDTEPSNFNGYMTQIAKRSNEIKDLIKNRCLKENPDARPDKDTCLFLLGHKSNYALFEGPFNRFVNCAECYESRGGSLPEIVKMQIERDTIHFNYIKGR